jgi:hypothetical protein
MEELGLSFILSKQVTMQSLQGMHVVERLPQPSYGRPDTPRVLQLGYPANKQPLHVDGTPRDFKGTLPRMAITSSKGLESQVVDVRPQEKLKFVPIIGTEDLDRDGPVEPWRSINTPSSADGV